MKDELKLISMSDIEAGEVRWIWYPYIPLGKVTIVQGDPGDGKTASSQAPYPSPRRKRQGSLTALLLLFRSNPLRWALPGDAKAAARTARACWLSTRASGSLRCVTSGWSRLFGRPAPSSSSSIPCRRASSRTALTRFRASAKARPLRCSSFFGRTRCAGLRPKIRKQQGQKASYRGLGSIDFRAAARSVLLVGRLKKEPTIRVVAHDKSSLAPEGASIAFELSAEHGFRWLGACEVSVDELLEGRGSANTKTAQMEDELKRMLSSGAMPADEVQRQAEAMGVSLRTLMIAKKNLGILSERQDGRWFWRLPEQECKDVSL